MKQHLISLVLFFSFLLSSCMPLKQTEVTSPNGHIRLAFALDGNNHMTYQVSVGDTAFVTPSLLGFLAKDGVNLAEGFKVINTDFTTHDETWTQPWGENKNIRNHYNEMAFLHLSAQIAKISVLPLRNKLLNYARKLTESPDDAEDAVQEVLLKLWNKRLELEQYRNIEAFAMTMTHNLCMDMWRTRHTASVPLEYVQDATPGGTPERLLEIKDEIRLMHEIINSLPTLQRTIMRMKDIEEYETEEIADITGCNPEAIRSNLSRARKKVREIYLQTVQEKIRRKQV